MNKFKNFLLNLQFIFKPHFWLMNNKYSAMWDKIFNQLLDKNKFIYIDEYTARLGKYDIWVKCYPYACMRLVDWSNTQIVANFRPSRLTIQKAYKKYLKDINPKVDLYDKWFKK